MAWGYAPGTHPYQAGSGTGTPTYSPPTQFQQNLGQGLAYNQPSLLQSQLGMDAGYRNLGYGQAGYGLDQTGLQNNYTSDSRDLALQQGQNGIDLRAAQRQPQLLQQLLGLDNQDYGLNHQGFELDRGDAGLAYRKNLSSIESDATARGAFGASGTNKQRAFNYESLAQQMGHIGVADDKNSLAQQRNTLTSKEQSAQAQDRIDALNMTAGRLGMKSDELRSTLDTQLQKLGLNHAVSTDDILDGISKNDLQAKQILYSIIQQAGQYATAGK